MRKKSIRLRRACSLVAYWEGSQIIIENYVNHARISAEPETTAILQYFSTWRSPSTVYSAMASYEPTSVAAVVRELVRLGFLLGERTREAAKDDKVERVWSSWLPAAGFLHFSARDTKFVPMAAARRFLRERARSLPPPPPVKHCPRVPWVALPAPKVSGELSRLLLSRRTWRRFSPTPLALSDLATLLWMTWGVQAWMELPIGRVPMKTSPSGGARHPIEVYVLVRNVSGLRAGIYHYAADKHRLELLKRGASSRMISDYLVGQNWFAGAAALLLMTAVFPRSHWKYHNAITYRIIASDAGHLCQTLCLLATSLGLAPFCTQALAESKIEKDLGIDGIEEAVLYVAGVGTRPRGNEQAPGPTSFRWPLSRQGLPSFF
jgi:SagB-type dehydrogenase family enzyme